MGYHLTSSPEIAAPVNSLASPKTHGPFSRVEERGLRYYSSETGRWLSRDPAGENGGLCLYVTCANNLLFSIDDLGLWKTDVHKTKTIEWATGTLSMPASGATLIGEKDDYVDTLWNPLSVSEDTWKYHFNRNAVGADSRLELAEAWSRSAKWMCDWTGGGNDDWETAGTWMGYSLHPAQDYVAHGDYNAKAQMQNPSAWPWWLWLRLAHNWDAPYRGSTGDPDNKTKDALQKPSWSALAPNGRPVITAMVAGTRVAGAGTTYWARYTDSGGGKRLQLTQTITASRLTGFMNYVRRYAKPCGECRRHFLP